MAKVKFEKSKSNGVSVKVNIGDDTGFTFERGMYRSIRRNEGADATEYPFIVAFKYFYRFLELNDVDYKEVEIDKNSIDIFYGYDNYGVCDYFVNPAPSKVDNWWNYDCPRLYRITVNKDEGTNILGMRLLTFEHLLCESTWSATYIGEDITEKEVKAFCRDKEHTAIYNEMLKVLEARRLKEEDIEKIKQDLHVYDAKVQAVIDTHKEEIIDAIRPYENKDFGLDCGWVNVYTYNEDYNEKRKLLKNTKGELRVDCMDIKLPYMCQSTTVQKMQFELIKELVEQELGEKLYAQTLLD